MSLRMRNFGGPDSNAVPEPSAEEINDNRRSGTTGQKQSAIHCKNNVASSKRWTGSDHSTPSNFPANTNQQFISRKATVRQELDQDVLNRETEVSYADISMKTKQLAKELDELVSRSTLGASSASQGNLAVPAHTVADLQLQTARKLRQLLPTNRELMTMVRERDWIPLLLGWLNLHDRPEIQVEALLALANIADLSTHQTDFGSAQTSAVGSGSSDATIPSYFSHPSPPNVGELSSGRDSGSSSLPSYPPLPLSFPQKLTPEAFAALDATLSSTLQETSLDPEQLPPSCTGAPEKEKSTKKGAAASPMSPPPVSSTNFKFQSSKGNVQPMPSYMSSSGVTPSPFSEFSGLGTSSFSQHLSSSSQHLLLRHPDAVPTLISLLSSPNMLVCEQAMWMLGSIAAGDTHGAKIGSGSVSGDKGRDKFVGAREKVLSAGIMNQLLKCVESHPQNLSLQRIGSWTLSNLVEGLFQHSGRGKSGGKNSDFSGGNDITIVGLLPVLRRLVRMADAEVLSYTCWTLSHLCDGPSSHISAVVTTHDGHGGLVPRLVELLTHQSYRVTKPALRTIGNIVCAECSEVNKHGSSSSSGPADYTEVILQCGAVPRLKELVAHSNREIQKEACWTLSNIAAGTVNQIQSVIDSGAIPPLVKLVGNKNTDQEVRSEACWVVLNATSCGSDTQIEVLVDQGCVSVLGVLLEEANMVMMALEGLERVLQVEENREAESRGDGSGDSDLPPLVSASLVEKALNKQNSSAVTKRANRIWKQHFVSCALCNKSFSKHRTCDATFCDECKCYVCNSCDCKMYHLSYQEELWGVNNIETKKSTKKSKSKSKKKQKQKKAKQVVDMPQLDSRRISKNGTGADPSSLVPETRRDKLTPSKEQNSTSAKEAELSIPDAALATIDPDLSNDDSDISQTRNNANLGANDSSELSNEMDAPSNDSFASIMDKENDSIVREETQPPVDFVLYLQETGSIIALSKLMDALDGGDYMAEDCIDSQLLRRHRQMLNQQATT